MRKEKTPPQAEPVLVPAIAVIAFKQEHLFPLLSSGTINVKKHNGVLTVFFISFSHKKPGWFSLPPEFDSTKINVRLICGDRAVRTLQKELKHLNPILVGMALEDKDEAGRYLAGKNFEPVLQQLSCPVYLMNNATNWDLKEANKAFVPFWDDDNTRFAITTVLEMSPNMRVTTGRVFPPTSDADEREMQQEEFRDQTRQWQYTKRLETKLIYSFNEEEALLQEAVNYDFLLIGASKGNRLVRTLFGDFRNELVNKSKGPTIILRESQGKTGFALFTGWSILDKLLPTLSKEDRIEAYRQIRRGGRPNRDFFSMTALSAGIASLGLLLNSVAVIIGAMLVAPLMSAITGMGLAIIHGDLRFLFVMLKAAMRGAAIAIITGYFFGLVNFNTTITQEILQRTEPSSLDLIVALISGIAAAYALCRKNVSNSLPGVAIAVALVPPLATVGVCLSSGLFVMAWGAFQLYLSNMVAIVFASVLVFASFGFRPKINLSEDNRRFKVFHRSFLTSGGLVLLMFIMLVYQTDKDIQDAALKDEIQINLAQYLGELNINARVSDWKISKNKGGDTLLTIQLQSPDTISQKEVDFLEEKLESSLEKNITLDITVIQAEILHSE